ncbi:MAG: PsiF family protein, partial [Ramlibacter sp.]
MNKLVSLMALGLALSFGSAHAASHAGAPMAKDDAKTPQQTRMTTCNADAKDKKGDERKKFMSECLKAKPEATAQQTKMTTCNADAKDKKGDERKK